MKVMLFAYLDNNIGDDLMLKLLSERFPSYIFYFYTSNTVVINTLRQFNNFTLRCPSNRKEDLDSVDAILSIGGSIFNDLNTFRGKIARLKKFLFLLNAKRKRKLIATVGCNLGPYKDKLGWYLTVAELKLNSLITVRDDFSFQLLSCNNFIQNYYLADDIVYGLQISNTVENRSGLGISSFRSTHTGENNYQNYQVLALIADEYIKKTNNSVKIFAFDSEIENDISAAFHIFNLIQNKKNVEIIPYLGDIEGFVQKFSNCERHISIRFHSAILSDLMKIPFYPIAYSNKMEAFISEKFPNFDLKTISSFNSEELNLSEIMECISNSSELCYTNHKSNFKIHFDELDKLWSGVYCVSK